MRLPGPEVTLFVQWSSIHPFTQTLSTSTFGRRTHLDLVLLRMSSFPLASLLSLPEKTTVEEHSQPDYLKYFEHFLLMG